MIDDLQLNIRNMKKLLGQAPQALRALRFDSNNNCNVHCVYCHNARSDDLIALADFQAFLDESVTSIEEFQIGCVMEPTLDVRMCDFMDIIANSAVRPTRGFRLQTNGILLHRHDPDRIRAAGLTHLSVSVDSAEQGSHEELRGGTSLAKVARNLSDFHRVCPSVRLMFLTTVTSANIDLLRELVLWGLDIGVHTFVFRQMFYYPKSRVVDHSRMQFLLVSPDAFAEACRRISGEFSNRASILFLESSTLVERASRVRLDSQTG
jgi:MoaA/NifB/PqqE/SkfB family radical SAM enzyme